MEKQKHHTRHIKHGHTNVFWKTSTRPCKKKKFSFILAHIFIIMSKTMLLPTIFTANTFKKPPFFLKRDALKLCDFIKSHVKYGDKNQIMYRIDHGKIKPSKNLADQLVSMLKGNEEFVMIDDQKVVYETAIKYAIESSEQIKMY